MRRAWVDITYNDVNITRDISPFLLSFAFTERRDKQADEVALTLEDRDGRWQNAWAVKRGDIIKPVLVYENWFHAGQTIKIDCGSFELDEDALASSTGGDVLNLKGMPASVRSSLASQKKTRAWEAANLERIAADIAGAAGLPLLYRAPVIPLARTDQRGESDLAFLQRLATSHGCRLRVTGAGLVILSSKAADALEPLVITRSAGESFNARRSISDIYKDAVIAFTDPKTARTTRYTYTPPDAPATGKTLTLNQRVESPEQAQQVAAAALRDKNCLTREADWSGMAQPLARAGLTVDMQGWGVYGGLYSISEATHEIQGGGAAASNLRLTAALEY